MKIYAIIDTNVLVSSMLKWESVPGAIIQFAFTDVIVPVYNADILKEYQEVLSRPKFGFHPEIVKDVVSSFTRHGVYLDGETLEISLSDPKDVVFYEVVMEMRKDEDAYLVTGNTKHFPLEPFVVTPRQMLDIIKEASPSEKKK